MYLKISNSLNVSSLCKWLDEQYITYSRDYSYGFITGLYINYDNNEILSLIKLIYD